MTETKKIIIDLEKCIELKHRPKQKITETEKLPVHSNQTEKPNRESNAVSRSRSTGNIPGNLPGNLGGKSKPVRRTTGKPRSSSVRFKIDSKSDSTRNLLSSAIDTRSEYSCSSIDLTTYVLKWEWGPNMGFI